MINLNESLLTEYKKKNFYIYGATKIASYIIPSIKKLGLNLKGILDRSPLRINKEINGILTLSSKSLHEIEKDSIIIIASTYFKSIISDINEVKNNFVILNPIFFLEYSKNLKNDFEKWQILEIERDILGLKKKISFFENKNLDELIITSIDVVVTERCSLNCKDCSNLMPYFKKPINITTEDIKNSLLAISKHAVFINELRIIGGEPFMNKDIHNILNDCLNLKNFGKIIIYTNATIVPKPNTLEILKNEKIILEITNYKSLSRKFDELIKILSENKINFKVRELPETWDDSAIIKDFSRDEQNLENIFEKCCSKFLTTLMHGKLYRCPFSASLHAINSIKFDKNDYLDLINNNITKENMINFLNKKKYVNSCNFCKGRGFEFDRVQPAVQSKELRVPEI